jgi:hypothetical protein
MKDSIKNRVISFIKSDFTSVEYFTRPISIKPEIKINLTLYKYITRNYFMKDFENIFHNTYVLNVINFSIIIKKKLKKIVK